MLGRVSKSYRIVVGKPRRRWKENIRTDVKNGVRGFVVDSTASGFNALRT
jgi:hypothetical protein